MHRQSDVRSHRKPPARAGRENVMKIQDARRVVVETTATRDKAEALLEALRRARRESDRQMKALGLCDKLQEATGRSLYDNAIESTRRMVDTLNRCVRNAKKDLDIDLDQDLQGLSEAEIAELRELDAEIFHEEPSRHGQRAPQFETAERRGTPASP
jgi:hypothetical protein